MIEVTTWIFELFQFELMQLWWVSRFGHAVREHYTQSTEYWRHKCYFVAYRRQLVLRIEPFDFDSMKVNAEKATTNHFVNQFSK